VDACGITDVGQDQAVVLEQRPAFDRQLGPVETALVTIQHEQSGRLEAGQLPTQLRTDRTAGPCHQHTPAGDVLRDRLRIDVGRVTAEEVEFIHRANVGCSNPPNS
jgi:hypothetical protein